LTISAEKANELAIAYTAAWCSHSAEDVASFYAPDGGIIINEGEPYPTRTDVQRMAQGFIDEFPDLELIMDSIRTSGTHSVFLWTLKGTHLESGNEVTLGGWEYWTLNEEGQVVQSMGHFDADDYQRQLDA